MKVSVAIAIYNGERHIDKQLSSIVNQTLVPDEIVITDDSDNDSTFKIIKKYIENYKNIKFLYIKNDKKLGFCKNFFKAILNTTGDIVFLSDQDDIWDSTKIEEMSKCMHGDDGIKLLCCKYQCVNDKEETISGIHEYSTSFSYLFKSKILHKKYFKMNYRELFKILTFPGMAFAIRKDLIYDLRKFLDIVDENFIIYHDVALLYLASIVDGFYIYNKKFVNYRMHGDNAIGINFYNGKGKTDRVIWLDEIIGNQKLILCYENNYGKDIRKIDYLKELINYNIDRQNYLKDKNFIKAIFSIVRCKYMLSMKAYVGDIVYTLYKQHG